MPNLEPLTIDKWAKKWQQEPVMGPILRQIIDATNGLTKPGEIKLSISLALSFCSLVKHGAPDPFTADIWRIESMLGSVLTDDPNEVRERLRKDRGLKVTLLFVSMTILIELEHAA
ncbi:hypothetical protein EXS71_04455 [Candidatus Uhrbacteria bacterium]|nr:hypothetical protein [Candidatus Uhrbacteria bacterium]